MTDFGEQEDLDRRQKIAALHQYLASEQQLLGPIPVDEQRAAGEWADVVLAARP
jgi:hypothetical protein